MFSHPDFRVIRPDITQMQKAQANHFASQQRHEHQRRMLLNLLF